MNKKEYTFLKYGIPSDLSKRLLNEKLTVSAIRNTNSDILKSKFKLTKDEVSFIKKCITRAPIKIEVINDLLINNNFTCCCCLGQKGLSYIIHHIDEYEIYQNNDYSNLALLCPVCHDLAHSSRCLTLSITKDQVRLAKETWEKSSKQRRNELISLQPIFDTYQVKYTDIDDDLELNYLFDLTLMRETYIVKGFFNLIYLNRGNIILAGEFFHGTERLDVDIKVSFWEMQWGIRSSKISKCEAILNYVNDDLIIWRNLDRSKSFLPMIIELNKSK